MSLVDAVLGKVPEFIRTRLTPNFEGEFHRVGKRDGALSFSVERKAKFTRHCRQSFVFPMNSQHHAQGNWLRCGLLTLGAIALCLTSLALPAQAQNCYHRGEHTICLERVQRSAKYHGRYRVTANIDGQRQPLARYDCRDRTRIPLKGPQKGRSQKFTEADIGDQLCVLVNR